MGILDRLDGLAGWLPDPAADTDTDGHRLGETRGAWHQPGRRWFGQVMPGTWAPNVDSDGVDGKIAGIAAIRAHDPAFDENVFLGDVQRLFFAVLEAWTAQKPALSQGVMASAIWEQQRRQIADYRSSGRRNLLPSLGLISAVVAGASSDNGWDTLTARINASSGDYDIEAASGRVLAGEAEPWAWTEDWIFQRPATALSAQRGTTTALSCPSCGAPVNVDITSICPFCDAAIISGKFGWSLTRIDRV